MAFRASSSPSSLMIGYVVKIELTIVVVSCESLFLSVYDYRRYSLLMLCSFSHFRNGVLKRSPLPARRGFRFLCEPSRRRHFFKNALEHERTTF